MSRGQRTLYDRGNLNFQKINWQKQEQKYVEPTKDYLAIRPQGKSPEYNICAKLFMHESYLDAKIVEIILLNRA